MQGNSRLFFARETPAPVFRWVIWSYVNSITWCCSRWPRHKMVV